MKRKDKNKTSTPSSTSITPTPEPSPLEIALLKEKFEMDAKMAKKWGRLSTSIVLQINAINT